jgi:gluconate:H+ symporter, GntP family
MSPAYLIILVLLTIVFIVVTGAYLKWHPFFSLLLASLGFGLLSGQPLATLIGTITNGFGSLIGAIGLIVVLGSILGVALEESGAVEQLGQALYARAGKRPSLGIAFLGMVLGIPVFCDSGFIVLVSLSRSLAASTHTSLSAMNLSLAGGLYTTHTLVPPTPGPVAAAGNLGALDSLGLIILLGLLVSVPVIMVIYYFTRYIGKSLDQQMQTEQPVTEDNAQCISSLIYSAILLLVLPVLLIASASALQYAGIEFTFKPLVLFFGNPVMALLISVILAFILFRSNSQTLTYVTKGIYQAGPIVLLTGCGGALGAVLKSSALTNVINDWAQSHSIAGVGFILTGFFLSALLKTAQGSSTSALVIVSTMLAPLAAAAGFTGGLSLALLVLGIGAGAMTVSHANDSYFWVVSQFSGLDLRSAYRGITVMTLLQGFTALTMVLMLYGLLL